MKTNILLTTITCFILTLTVAGQAPSRFSPAVQVEVFSQDAAARVALRGYIVKALVRSVPDAVLSEKPQYTLLVWYEKIQKVDGEDYGAYTSIFGKVADCSYRTQGSIVSKPCVAIAQSGGLAMTTSGFLQARMVEVVKNFDHDVLNPDRQMYLSLGQK